MVAPKPPKTRLGSAIRAARINLGWKSQGQLADALAAIGYPVSQDTVSEWERGTRIPRPDEVIALERVLKLVDEGTLREARDRDAEERAEEIMATATLPAAEDNGADPGWMCLPRLTAISDVARRTLVPILPRPLASTA